MRKPTNGEAEPVQEDPTVTTDEIQEQQRKRKLAIQRVNKQYTRIHQEVQAVVEFYRGERKQ